MTTAVTTHMAALDAVTQDRDYAVAEVERTAWYEKLYKASEQRMANEKSHPFSPKTKATVDSGFVDEGDIATLRVHLASSPTRMAKLAASSTAVSASQPTPSPPTVPSSSFLDRDFNIAEAELAAYRARREAIATVLEDASGDRWDYANAAKELAAFRAKQAAAISTTATATPSPTHAGNEFQDQPGAVDFRNVYSAEAELAAFRAKKEAVAAALRESNVDRWGYDAAASELAAYRAVGSAIKKKSSTMRTIESKKNVEQEFSVDSRRFNEAEAELAAFRAKQAALQDDNVDRGYDAAAAELAAYRSSQNETGSHPNDATPAPAPAIRAPTKAATAVGSVHGREECADIDSRDCYSAEAELAAFRKRQMVN